MKKLILLLLCLVLSASLLGCAKTENDFPANNEGDLPQIIRDFSNLSPYMTNEEISAELGKDFTEGKLFGDVIYEWTYDNMPQGDAITKYFSGDQPVLELRIPNEDFPDRKANFTALDSEIENKMSNEEITLSELEGILKAKGICTEKRLMEDTLRVSYLFRNNNQYLEVMVDEAGVISGRIQTGF